MFSKCELLSHILTWLGKLSSQYIPGGNCKLNGRFCYLNLIHFSISYFQQRREEVNGRSGHKMKFKNSKQSKTKQGDRWWLETKMILILNLRAIRNWDELEEQGLKKKVPAATVVAGTFFSNWVNTDHIFALKDPCWTKNIKNCTNAKICLLLVALLLFSSARVLYLGVKVQGRFGKAMDRSQWWLNCFLI